MQVKGDGYAVASTSDLTLHSGSQVAGSYTEAAEILERLMAQDPSLRGKVQIVSEHELVV
mgnify:FL=1